MLQPDNKFDRMCHIMAMNSCLSSSIHVIVLVGAFYGRTSYCTNQHGHQTPQPVVSFQPKLTTRLNVMA